MQSWGWHGSECAFGSVRLEAGGEDLQGWGDEEKEWLKYRTWFHMDPEIRIAAKLEIKSKS